MWHVSNKRSPGHHTAMCTCTLHHCVSRGAIFIIQINEMKSLFHICYLCMLTRAPWCPLSNALLISGRHEICISSNFTLYPKKLSITALQPKWWPQSLLPGDNCKWGRVAPGCWLWWSPAAGRCFPVFCLVSTFPFLQSSHGQQTGRAITSIPWSAFMHHVNTI